MERKYVVSGVLTKPVMCVDGRLVVILFVQEARADRVKIAQIWDED